MPLAVDFQGGVTSAWSNVITFVPKLAAALLVILAGYLIAKVVASVLNKVLDGSGSTAPWSAAVSSRPWPEASTTPPTSSPSWPSGSSSWSACRSPSGSSDLTDQRPAPGPDRLSAQRAGGHRHHRGRRGHRQ